MLPPSGAPPNEGTGHTIDGYAGMDKTHTRVLGKKLRQTYVVPDELPFPMRKALAALGAISQEELPVTRGHEGGVRNIKISIDQSD